MQTKQWNVEISITEDDADDLTTARAVLLAGDGTRHESVAHARRSPGDQAVPDIGDELAAGRALSDLSAKLLEDGAEDVARLANATRISR
ncbi:dsRBD fold-containing protein [Planobispora longispora]|nr:dsRBD fold-containing protein [Planobispora longispora]